MELTATFGRLMKTAPLLKDASASGNMTVSISFNNGPTCTSRGTWTAQDQN